MELSIGCARRAIRKDLRRQTQYTQCSGVKTAINTHCVVCWSIREYNAINSVDNCDNFKLKSIVYLLIWIECGESGKKITERASVGVVKVTYQHGTCIRNVVEPAVKNFVDVAQCLCVGRWEIFGATAIWHGRRTITSYRVNEWVMTKCNGRYCLPYNVTAVRRLLSNTARQGNDLEDKQKNTKHLNHTILAACTDDYTRMSHRTLLMHNLCATTK